MEKTQKEYYEEWKARREEKDRAIRLYKECQRMLAGTLQHDFGANYLGPLGFSIPQGSEEMVRAYVSQLREIPGWEKAANGFEEILEALLRANKAYPGNF